MTEGDAAGVQAQRFQGHDLFAVQGDQRVRRAHELHGGAIRALVAHQFWNGQLAQRFIEGCLQTCGEGDAFGRITIKEALGLAVLGPFQLSDGDVGAAHGSELLGQRRGGVAGGIEGHRHRQHFFADRFVRRGGAHIGDRHRQAARGGERGDDAVGVEEIARFQALFDTGGKGGAQFDEGLGRQFFGTQFNQ